MENRTWLTVVFAMAACSRPGGIDLQQPVGRTHSLAPTVTASSSSAEPSHTAATRDSSEREVSRGPEPPARVEVPQCDLPDTPEEALLFSSNDTGLRQRETQILDDLVACMERGLLPDSDLLLVGLSDARGSAEYNRELALERARRVKLYLVRRGIPEERISIETRGERLARGRGPETWMFDRRVEISLIPR